MSATVEALRNSIVLLRNSIVLLQNSEVHLYADKVELKGDDLVLTGCRRVLLTDGKVDEDRSPREVSPTFRLGLHNVSPTWGHTSA